MCVCGKDNRPAGSLLREFFRREKEMLPVASPAGDAK